MSGDEQKHDRHPRNVVPEKYAVLDDERLVEMAKNQDLVAIEVLVSRYSAALLGFLRKRSPHDYEDVYQETFASALASLASLRRNASFGPWLFGIAKRQIASRARSRAREVRFAADERASNSDAESILHTPERSNPLETAQRDEHTELILKCVLGQPDPYGLILYMRLVHERSPTQIAKELGMKPSTVRMRLKRGIAKLRKSLSRLEIECPSDILEESCDDPRPPAHYIEKGGE